MKALITIVLLLTLGAVARANLAPVERQTFALSHGNTNIGLSGAMHGDIGSAGAMRERKYFEPFPSGSGVFRCRFEPVLFSMIHLAQACR